jgi:hypothetical protein
MIRKDEYSLWSPPIWVDFMARDANWRVPLDYPGTVNDLSRSGLTLADGMYLTLYTHDATADDDLDELVALGSAEFDNSLSKWFASVDPDSFVHVSEMDEPDQHLYRAARGSI